LENTNAAFDDTHNTYTHSAAAAAAAKNKKGVKELLFWALLFQVTRKETKI